MSTTYTHNDYTSLAVDLIHHVHVLNKYGFNQKFAESQRGEGMVLGYLMHQDQAVTPSEIAQHANLTSARIATILKTLEKKALITRTTDPSDQRRCLVELTTTGCEAAKEFHASVMHYIEKMLASIGINDATEYVRILGKLARSTQANYQEEKQ
ncbi:MarR family winged helix-turn-helix transcriptional regulator [Gleimia coleocanis]|uniref:MarR family winged helix-turn-helix transcriptional regulator n=1 Tax=Gleimia coleocanis TaxID=103618 RepID=UPI001B7FB567|nr:MarR family transcriptional regulator [Gleimia coleocanis]